jgi:hypothetical protein
MDITLQSYRPEQHDLHETYSSAMNWTSLIPLAGVALGSGLTLIGQKLTDGRAVRRDQMAARQEATQRLRTDWLILQRQTAIELQESLELIATTAQPPGPARRMRDSVADEAARAVTKMHSRLARLEDQQLVTDIRSWLDSAMHTEERLASMNTLQARLGAFLRTTHDEP